MGMAMPAHRTKRRIAATVKKSPAPRSSWAGWPQTSSGRFIGSTVRATIGTYVRDYEGECGLREALPRRRTANNALAQVAKNGEGVPMLQEVLKCSLNSCR